jgi:hypothetical protein
MNSNDRGKEDNPPGLHLFHAANAGIDGPGLMLCVHGSPERIGIYRASRGA